MCNVRKCVFLWLYTLISAVLCPDRQPAFEMFSCRGMVCKFTSAWSQVWMQLPPRSWHSNCERFLSPPSIYTLNSCSEMPKDTIKTWNWRANIKHPLPHLPSWVDGIHFGRGEWPDSWDKEHSGLWHAATAPSVAALKIHAVWCRHTSQLSGRGREGGKKERWQTHRQIQPEAFETQQKEREKTETRKREIERTSESNREDIDKGAHNSEERGGGCPRCDIAVVGKRHEQCTVHELYQWC